MSGPIHLEVRGADAANHGAVVTAGQEIAFVLWLFEVTALAGGLAFDAMPFVTASGGPLLAATIVRPRWPGFDAMYFRLRLRHGPDHVVIAFALLRRLVLDYSAWAGERNASVAVLTDHDRLD
jgi:hypothetical protein